MIPGNTLPLLLGGAGTIADYRIARGLRFNNGDSAFLSRTPGTAGNRKTWTWSGWVKNNCVPSLNYPVTMISAQSGGGIGIDNFFWVAMNANFQIEIGDGTGGIYLRTNAIFADPSAWYHFVCVFDSTQAGAANRFRLYVNGGEVTSFVVDARSSIPLNIDSAINNNIPHAIGRNFTSFYSNCYFADIHFVAGQALTPSSFGETNVTTGQWQPRPYAGLFGAGGFHLKFVDNSASTSSTLGKDYSGNNNNWTPNNLSVVLGAGNDSVADAPSSSGVDLPSGGVVNGNYCVFNPFDKGNNLSASNGNLQWSEAIGSWGSVRGTLPLLGGKWYWEVSLISGSGCMFGIANNSAITSNYFPTSPGGYGYYQGTKFNNNINASYGTGFTNGDTIGVAYDADAGALYFYKNGVAQNGGVAAFTGITGGPYFPAIALIISSVTVNFGQQPFLYQTAGVNRPSADYKAVCDTNLPVPSIVKPSTVMDVKLYTGNGTSQTIATEFEPGLIWMKSRSLTADNILQDSNRGFSSTTKISSNLTNSENANSFSSSTVSAISASGFTVSGSDALINQAFSSYVAWIWKSASTGVSNTNGSVASTVRTNLSAGMSIVSSSYPGFSCTVGHGLNAVPQLIIYKNRINSSSNWPVYHRSTPSPTINVPLLNQTSITSGSFFSALPTSTVFTIASGQFSGDFIAYCFSEVAGYSSFGSYTGNSSTNGTFINLGFTPVLILIKNITSGVSAFWYMLDLRRSPSNTASQLLFPNSSSSEIASSSVVDILSNGFRLKNSDAGLNGSGNTYIYAAWAANPFNYARGR